MTVSSSLDRQTFACNGVTTAFTCPFGVLDSSEVVGYLITVATNASADLTNGVDFTVSAVGDPNCIVTTVTAYSSTYQVKFRRQTARLQLTDYRDNDPFPAESTEQALDRLTHIDQEQDSAIARALLFPEPEAGSTLPAATTRAGFLLGFDSSGNIGLRFPQASNYSPPIVAELQTAIAGQTVFDLTRVDFEVGVNAIGVYVDGQRMIPAVDYTETSTSQITFASGLLAGQQVLFESSRVTSIETPYGKLYAPDDYGAVAGVAVDNITAINAAASAASLDSGGALYISRSIAIASTLKLPSGVDIVFGSGAQIIWIGSASETVVDTDSTQVYRDARWHGMWINTGSGFTGVALAMHSAHNITADVIQLTTSGTTSVAMRMIADSSAGGDADTKRNITAVTIGKLVQHGQCGTLLETDGVTVGYGGSPNVVTLNTIGGAFAENCAQYGYNFKNWTDNNAFPGVHRVAINGNNSRGLQVGSSTAVGVYMNTFDLLAVDTFGTMTGRIGMVIDASKLTQVRAFYQNPVAEGGEFSSTLAATSYDVSLYRDSDARIVQYRRGMRTASEGFNSSDPIVLANNTATSINVAEAGADTNITFVLTVSTDNADSSGIAWMKVRRTAGSPDSKIIAASANFAVTTGALTGTTGTITKLTVSAGADGKVYIENRLGFSVTLTTHIAAWMQTA